MPLNVTYDGRLIGELSEDGSVTLKTANKQCSTDITLDYTGGGSTQPITLGVYYVSEEHIDVSHATYHGDITGYIGTTVSADTTLSASDVSGFSGFRLGTESSISFSPYMWASIIVGPPNQIVMSMPDPQRMLDEPPTRLYVILVGK